MALPMRDAERIKAELDEFSDDWTVTIISSEIAVSITKQHFTEADIKKILSAGKRFSNHLTIKDALVQWLIW